MVSQSRRLSPPILPHFNQCCFYICIIIVVNIMFLFITKLQLHLSSTMYLLQPFELDNQTVRLSHPTLHARQYGLVPLEVWSRNSAAVRQERGRSPDVPVVHRGMNVCLQHWQQFNKLASPHVACVVITRFKLLSNSANFYIIRTLHFIAL